MIKKSILFFSIFLFSANLFSQENFDILAEYEDSLQSGFEYLFSYDGTKYFLPDSEKIKTNAVLFDYFKEALEQENSWNYSFDSLKKVGIIYPDDKSFRIISWNIKFDDGTYKYYGFIQRYNKKSKKYDVWKLIDDSENMTDVENLHLDNRHWYGCLYYQIVSKKVNGKNIYNLIGWDGNNYLSHKKIIDVLYFTKKGEPKFGKKIFYKDNEKKSRIIFEYSARVVMFVKYEERYKRIVFDHLIPNPKSMVDNYAFYFPDGTYDAFEWNGSFWKYISDFYATNPADKEREKALKDKPGVKKSDEFYNPK